MKKNLETILNLWKLALECRGLTLGTGAKSEDMSPKGMLKRPTWIFNVSNLPCEALESDGVIQGSWLIFISGVLCLMSW